MLLYIHVPLELSDDLFFLKIDWESGVIQLTKAIAAVNLIIVISSLKENEP